jgi:hypothetical protein
MLKIMKKLYSPGIFDALFGVAGALGAVGLILEGGRHYPAISPTDPMTKGLAGIAVVVASVVLAISTTRLDQKLADDFLYQTLTKSAFIAMFGILFTAVLWQLLLARDLGGLSSFAMVGVLVTAWSLSWFYTRLRGTRA